jgi:transcriptional regulator GlxA family with amidase domain
LGECDVELDKTVVSDVNFITAAGPYYTIDFALKIVEELLGWDKSVEIAEQILYNTYYLPY